MIDDLARLFPRCVHFNLEIKNIYQTGLELLSVHVSRSVKFVAQEFLDNRAANRQRCPGRSKIEGRQIETALQSRNLRVRHGIHGRRACGIVRRSRSDNIETR
jgi:hypothetical protein